MRELRNRFDIITLSKTIINCHIQRDNLVLHSSNSGKQSLLAKYEPYFVEIIIKLAHYYYSVICSKRLELINSLIFKEEIQN